MQTRWDCTGTTVKYISKLLKIHYCCYTYRGTGKDRAEQQDIKKAEELLRQSDVLLKYI